MLKTVKMKKSEMIDIYMYCTNYTPHETHNKDIKYCVTFAKKKLEPDATALIDTYKQSEEYTKYENAKKDLVFKYAEKNEDGTPIELQPGVFKISKDVIEEVKSKLERIDSENATVIAEREAELKELDAKLEEEIELQLEVLEYDKLRDDIDDTILDALFPIIIKG